MKLIQVVKKAVWRILTNSRSPDWNESQIHINVSVILAESTVDYPVAKVIMEACQEDYEDGLDDEQILANARGWLRYAREQLPKRRANLSYGR